MEQIEQATKLTNSIFELKEEIESLFIRIEPIFRTLPNPDLEILLALEEASKALWFASIDIERLVKSELTLRRLQAENKLKSQEILTNFSEKDIDKLTPDEAQTLLKALSNRISKTSV